MAKDHSFRNTALLFALTLVLSVLADLSFYRFQEEKIRSVAEDEFLAVAKLKANQISEWRRARENEALAIVESPFFLEPALKIIRNRAVPADTAKMRENFRTLKRYFGYPEVILADFDGKVRLRLTGSASPIPKDMIAGIREAAEQGEPMMTPVHLSAVDGKPHVDVIVPLFSGQGVKTGAAGALMLKIDAASTLFPMVSGWPVPSKTAEVLLVRRDGNDVLFVSGLRHKPGAALNLRIPLTRTEVPAVEAVLGRTGIWKGKDYRGVQVLAALEPVPGSPWFIVAKEDMEETFAGWRMQSRLIFLLFGVFFAVLLALAATRWQQLQKARYREMYEGREALLKAELKNAEEKERLAVTLRSIGDGVITTDVQGKVALMNPVAEKLTGWPLKEASGRPLQEVFNIVNEFTRKPCENPVEKVIQTGTVSELANHTMLISRDNREYVIADSGSPIRTAEGGIIGVVLVFRDNTEKERMAAGLLRSQKLESLATLAAGIAHDFNNLLTGIFGFMDVARIAAEREETARAAAALSKALNVFERAKGLTQQLLTFSKGGSPMRRPQHLEPLLRRSAGFALSGSNVSFDVRAEADLWPCDIDETQIEQVLDNLFINAKQAMPDGGSVGILAENTIIEKGRHALLPAGGRFVRIMVADTGSGIDKETLPRIFDPFFSTKTLGHGLGLATAHSIIRRHNGCIEAESEPGKGSRFILCLPASSGPAARTEAPAARPEGRHGLVLIMDDEDFIREIAALSLKEAGFEPVCAEDGARALALHDEHRKKGAPFAAIILDLTVPGGKGGRETITELRKRDPAVPVIATSGYSEDPVMNNPAAFGFSGSLRKPFREPELLDILRRLIR